VTLVTLGLLLAALPRYTVNQAGARDRADTRLPRAAARIHSPQDDARLKQGYAADSNVLGACKASPCDEVFRYEFYRLTRL
jgi:hypothetical protein